MKRTFSIVAVLLLTAAPPAVAAEHNQMPMAGMPMAQGAEDQMHAGHGTVKKVAMEAGRITISHEPIQSLRWPAMTMSFMVADKSLLKDIRPGMKVDFELRKMGANYKITQITAAK